MKKRLFEVSKITIFLVIFVMILNCLSPIFVPKKNTKASGIKYENARGFYGEKENSLDIYALGNSDLYSALNPLQLWHDYGMTTYVSAEPSQDIFSAYYLLKEFLKHHDPQLVILEVDGLFSTSEANDLDQGINSYIKNVFPLFEYHSRWKTLDKKDFSDPIHYDQKMLSKGYIYHDDVVVNKNMDYMNKKRHTNITDTTKFALDKFIKLAHRHGAEVLFVWYPSATSATYARHDVVQDLANEHDVPFIDFNVDHYDTGFDWLTDSRDGGNHLNFSGATKMTNYMGRYLDQHYNLPDHRDNEEYNYWNDDYDMFMKTYVKKQKISQK